MSSRTLAVLTLALTFLNPVRGLSSWYTPPGGPPTGSTAGDKVRGVNLGGWFILENWMMPSFFEVSPLDQYNVPDEWTYCQILGKETCLERLQEHWDTYITEDDFKLMANYSMNTVRIPMGYWAWVDPEWYEPYVQGQLPYLERALNWSSWYGLDVMMDLHGLPGGQNGQDNQGLKGPIEFQNNATNQDRAMTALKNMTEFVTDAKWGGVVKAIELTNEPYITEYNPSGMDFYTLADFYVKGYEVVRASETILDGNNEVMVVIHDAFQPVLNWQYFFSTDTLGLNWTNYAVDTHIYDAFGDSSSKTNQEHLDTICALAANIAEAQTYYPVIVGEFSLGTQTYCVDYQSCWGLTLADVIANLTTYDASLFLRQFWEVQSDVYELGAGWIFWSIKHELAGPWSWSQSAAQNWIPEDPTEKIYPYNSSASSYCLETWAPLDGDQNMPSFPSSVNNVSSINLDYVVVKKNSTLMAANATISSSASAGSSQAASGSASGSATATISGSGSAASASTSQKSGAGRMGASMALVLGVAIVDGLMGL
ncbi:hypothetical protein EHS25_003197 [Saitozyma podzolica]|uniref:Glycoside hydrolase family 5 domain-containing protein n=1 Tax=Saitozyma podzolica TaxID=1890683 RepID=A0A427Y871_9TREE|nr:hypothetical protein EHS25_003197 [Saitozyma podzolica]